MFQEREQKMFFMEIHRWSGYIFAVGLLFHIAWHAKWIAFASKKCIGKEAQENG